MPLQNVYKKAFVCLDRMLRHWADPTNVMIGGDNSQTRSLCGVQVKQLAPDWSLVYPSRFKP